MPNTQLTMSPEYRAKIARMRHEYRWNKNVRALAAKYDVAAHTVYYYTQGMKRQNPFKGRPKLGVQPKVQLDLPSVAEIAKVEPKSIDPVLETINIALDESHKAVDTIREIGARLRGVAEQFKVSKVIFDFDTNTARVTYKLEEEVTL
jgi:transposase